MIGQADLHRGQSLTDFRPQFVGLVVVEEQRRALGVEHARRFAHHLLQQRADLDVGGDLGDDVEEFEFLLADRLHALDELGALQRQRALRGHRDQELHVGLVEAAARFVQHLRDANYFALGGDDGYAQDALGDEAGLFVDGAVEAFVGVGVVDDQAGAGCEHVTGNTAVVEEADFARGIALRHARIQLAGFRVVEKQSAALGLEFRGGDFDQADQHFVERVHAGHFLRNAEQQFGEAQPAIVAGARAGHAAAAAIAVVSGFDFQRFAQRCGS